jgi:hypothetical protein
MIDERIVERASEVEKPKIYGLSKEELDRAFNVYKKEVLKDQRHFSKYFGRESQLDSEVLYFNFVKLLKGFFRSSRSP